MLYDHSYTHKRQIVIGLLAGISPLNMPIIYSSIFRSFLIPQSSHASDWIEANSTFETWIAFP